MINNDTKQRVKEMKIETITDVGTFQELEAFASELLNSSDTANKMLALKIQQRLSQNPNYQDFIKRVEIEQQLEKAETEQKIIKQHEIKQQNASNNIEKKKTDEKRNEIKEKEIDNNFKKMTETQQKIFLEIEKSFAAEHRQALREFALTSGTKDEKKQQNVNLINEVMKKEVLTIENGKVDVKNGVSYDDLTEARKIQNKTTDAAIVAKNPTAALEGVQANTVMGAEQATITVRKKTEDNFYSAFQQSEIGGTQSLTERKDVLLKIKSYLTELKNNDTLQDYEDKITKVKKFGDKAEIESKEKEIQEDLMRKIKDAGIDLNNLDKKEAQNFIEQYNAGQNTKELLNKTLLPHAKDYTVELQQQENKYREYLEKKEKELEKPQIQETKEEQLAEIYASIKTGLIKYNTEAEKDEVLKMSKDMGYTVSKQEIDEYKAKQENANKQEQKQEQKVETEAKEQQQVKKEVEVYDPSVRGQKEKDGTAAEVHKEMVKHHVGNEPQQAADVALVVNNNNNSSGSN
ncbi:hypothetical protein ACWIVU_10885 [Ursidibacter arcticus]